MDKPFKNILIIKLRFHGDMLLTTPAIRSLKLNYPDARIDLVAYEETIAINQDNPDIYTQYGVKNKKAPLRAKVKNFIDIIRALRQQRYDLIINLTDQWLVLVLIKLLQAPVKISLQFAHRSSSFWRNAFSWNVASDRSHVVLQNLSVLKPLQLEKMHDATVMQYPPEAWHSLESALAPLKQGAYVVIQPTARQLFKCWDEEKFAAVTDALAQRNYPVVLTSGPGKDDLAIIQRISNQCQHKPVVTLAGKTSFAQLAALIDHASLFIGVDSAPMHIAAAVNTPIVCLFGATDHKFWRPWSNNYSLFWAGDYQPMPERKKLDRNHKYLSVIPADVVITAALRMLEESGQTRTEDKL